MSNIVDINGKTISETKPDNMTPDFTFEEKYHASIERHGKSLNLLKTFYRVLEDNKEVTPCIGHHHVDSILKAMNHHFKDILVMSPDDEN